MKPIKGSKMIKFSGFSLTNNIKYCVYSDIFVVGEYKWCICLYPNGDGSKKSLGFISIYLMLVSDKSLLEASFSLALVDPSNANKSIPLCSPPTCVYKKLDSSHTKSDYTWGRANMIDRKKLEKHPYYKDDSFTIECTVTIQKEFRVDMLGDAQGIAATDQIVPSFDLQKDLVSLLESGLGADVSFKVGTKTFNAHRCILAARSPVFRAQLYGPMKESTDMSILIDDIEAPVFKAMLHFMYSDSESYSYLDSTEDHSALMAQHLLVAADRYELDRLQTICEDQLMKSIDVANVATTLVLAEQHNCKELKAACLKFMTASDDDILRAVSLTEGFQHLCLSCPSIAKHLFLLKGISHIKTEEQGKQA